ncbi:MAG: hypothetical protein MR665_01435 [Selenomonas bovis]|nr:hypothetical protein [Selenomonas bovis]MCI7055444.1 hypothetical protein [Selenomonas bovis]
MFEAFSGALQGAAGSCRARVCQSVRCLRGARTLHIEDTYVSRRGRTRASSCSTRRCRSRRSASARACCGSVRRGEELFTRVPAQTRSKYDLLA